MPLTLQYVHTSLGFNGFGNGGGVSGHSSGGFEHNSGGFDEQEEEGDKKDLLKWKKDLLKKVLKDKKEMLKSKKKKEEDTEECKIIWEEHLQPHCATEYEEVSRRFGTWGKIYFRKGGSTVFGPTYRRLP